MTDLERACEAAFALATELEYEVPRPTVVADRSNLVLSFGGALIGRVAMATSAVRVGMAWLKREVEVSEFLAGRRVGVTTPIAGPFERAGFVISFWEIETLLSTPPDPHAAGAELKKAHQHLAEYEGSLPIWGGVREAQEVLARATLLTDQERTIVLRASEKAERIVEGARARSASFQAIHGDAHIKNVLATERGVLWTDWEDAFIGPIEFDLACLRSRLDLFGEEREAIEAMTAAYGDVDRALVADLGLVRNVQVIPWTAVFAERSPELLPRMRARIAKL